MKVLRAIKILLALTLCAVLFFVVRTRFWLDSEELPTQTDEPVSANELQPQETEAPTPDVEEQPIQTPTDQALPENVLELRGDTGVSGSDRVSINGGEIVVNAPCELTVSGTMTGGVLIIRGEGDVTLHLDNMTLQNASEAPFRAENNGTLVLDLLPDTVNRIDSKTKEQDSAAMLLSAELRVKGSGLLQVDCEKRGGILSTRSILLEESPSLEILCKKRGVQAANVILSGGGMTVESDGVGLYLENGLSAFGGDLTVRSEGHCVHCGGDASVTGGTLDLQSADKRGIFAEGSIQVSGGTLRADVLDDGLYAYRALLILGGDLTIRAGGDGLKAGGGRGSLDAVAEIRDGTVRISAYGDPVDANGTFLMQGGELYALGISGEPKLPTAESGQTTFVFIVRGAKGDQVEIRQAEQSLFRSEAAYGFNTVLISCPALTSDQKPALTINEGEALLPELTVKGATN